MAETYPGRSELEGLRADINTLDDGLGTHIEQAILTPTENETRLVREHQTLQEELAHTRAERDQLQAQRDELAAGIRETRVSLREVAKKHGITLRTVAILFLIAGIGAGALVYDRYHPLVTQVATSEPVAPGFPMRSVA